MSKSAYLINLKQSITYLFSKENLTFKNILCYSSIVYCFIIALLGFVSSSISFYVGDFLARVFLIILFLFIFSLLVISFKEQKRIRPLITMSIFVIIVLLVAYFLPLFPPQYELRQFDVDASLLKFMITSIIFIILGILGASFTMKPLYNFSSQSKQAGAYFVLIFSMILILYPLGIIVGNIVVNGIGGITWEFLTEDVSRHGTQGGIFPALVGTLLIIIGTILIALPLGISSAVYLHEYARSGPIIRVLRIAVDILQGTPSIVHGLFGLAFFVPLFGISVLSGVLIMSFLTLPIIIRASEEALRSVPQNVREGSYALGATKWQTIRRVVLPPALPGIITGGVLGLGRAAGETAPIMFTAVAFIGAGIPKNLFQPIQALPYHLLTLTRYFGAYEVEQNAWATALLLIGIVLGINAFAIIIRERFRVEF